MAETRGLSARERLGVYAGGYVLRLLECMRADFPALRGFVGDSVFDAFARAYVITRPPGSPSLYELGADFPRFLEETKPEGEGLDESLRPMLELKFPLVDFLRMSEGGELPEPPEPRASFVALGCADYRLRVEEVTPWQFALLKACGRPSPLYAAAGAAALEVGEEPGRVFASAAVWLPVAFESGFLRRAS